MIQLKDGGLNWKQSVFCGCGYSDLATLFSVLLIKKIKMTPKQHHLIKD